MSDLFDVDALQVSRRRNRSREGAIRSDASHIKHGLIKTVVHGQAAAWRIRHDSPIHWIDGNAGDGAGTQLPQWDLFDGAPVSVATAPLLIEAALRFAPGEVILCETNRTRRSSLAEKFPTTLILSSNAAAPERCPPKEFFIWVSDPCGSRGHGVEAMAALGAKSARGDFVVVQNEGWLNRLDGTQSKKWECARQLYLPMVDPEWWLKKLCRQHLSRTKLIKASPNFHYRVLVVGNYLTDAARRRPFEVFR